MIFTGFGASAATNARSIIRTIESPGPRLFLTFDDGPDMSGTPAVLDVLARHHAKATFFVVAHKISAQPKLIERILREGHAIGNHSLDHDYAMYFSGAKKLQNWVEQAEQRLRDHGITESVGFRPPAGVCTPPLFAAVNSLDLALILWSRRFFDTAITWSESRLRAALPQFQNGEVILLHDRQKSTRLKEFLATLDTCLTRAGHRGFEFEALTKELCARQRSKQLRQ